MAAFHIDEDGNIWIGQNTSNVFSTALTQTDPNDPSLPRVKFYVTKAGAINAISGEIGGIVIDADGIESDNYDESTKTGWRLDNLNGVGNYFDINIILPSALSDNPSTGRTTLDFGNSKIFDFNNDLFLEANDDVIVKSVLRLGYASDGLSEPRLLFGNSASTASSTINPIMGIESTLVSADTYGGSASNLARELNFSNGSSTAVMIMNSENDTVEFTGDLKLATSSDIYIGTDPGSNGDVLTKQNGNVVWAAAGGSHPDSDHTSFLTQSDADTRYVNESDHTHSNLVSSTSFNNHTSSATAHGTFDNYSYWRPRINGSNISGTIGSTDSLNFVAGNNITISEAGSGGTRNITFSAGGTAHTHTSVLSISVLDLNLYRDIKPSSSNSKRVGTSSTNRMLDVFSRDFHGGTFYGTLVNSSSRNTKTNIEDTGLGLDFIQALPVKEFNYITADHSDKKYTGVIAEDVTSILEANGWDDYYLVVDDSEKYSYNTRCSHPVKCDDSDSFYCEDDCCSSYFKYTEEDGSVSNWLHHTVEECEAYEVDGSRHPHFNYYQLIGPLVKSVQELSTQISDLTARVEALEG